MRRRPRFFLYGGNEMTRVALIALFVMTFAAALPAGSNSQSGEKLQAVKQQGQSGAQRNRPNIVFILADDLGRADVGFNGGKDIKTPNIDKLAASGARLEQFYAQPVCSPTRAALMTGRYPMRHGLQVGVIRPWANYDEGYSTHLLAEDAVKFINENAGRKPFFLYVPFNAVHAPHQTPEKYKEAYASLPDPRRTYAGMLAAMDEAVGRIIAALDEKGLRRDTIIIFSSDNGGPEPGRVTDNGPFRAGKATLYEGGVRVAACVAWESRIKPGARVDQPLHMVDWYPTLLRLAGASLKQKLPLDGRDAWGAIAEGKASPHAEILLNATPNTGAIRVGDWKLVLNGKVHADENEGERSPSEASLASVELFNLADDPYEKKNLAESDHEKVKELRARYDRLAAQAVPPKIKPKAADFKSPKIWGE